MDHKVQQVLHLHQSLCVTPYQFPVHHPVWVHLVVLWSKVECVHGNHLCILLCEVLCV